MKKFACYAMAAMMSIGFSACSDNDDKGEVHNPDLPTVSDGVFVLSQGTYGLNIEGSLDYIDYTTGTASHNLFQTVNHRSLGDTPQTAMVYGSKLYIGVYGSNTIEVIDRKTFRSEKQISLASELGQNPRSFAAKDGKIYVSMYNGYVARLDTVSLSIDKTVQVGPNPEIICIKGDYLYVPNSDGMNWMVGYGTTASKIRLSDFTVEKTFTVGLNPKQFVSDGTDLFLLCMGNYGDVPAKVYRLDGADGSQEIAEATLIAMGDKKLYYIDAPYGASSNTYGVYDIATGTKSAMLQDGGVDSPAAIGVDPITGKIIITSYSLDNGWTSYTTDGYAKEYDAKGALLKRYDVGVGPCCIFFNVE